MDDDTEMPEPTPAAFVSFYHGSPDANDIDIQLNSRVLNTQPFKYSTFSGYLPLSPETYNIKFTQVNAATAYVESTPTFKNGKAYSIFAVNTLANMEMLIVQDSVKAPASGKAGLRIINLSPDAPALDISTTGTTVLDLATDVAFKEITPFMEIDGKTYTLEIKNADTDEVLLTVTSTNFQPNVTYSLIIRGFATPPSGNTNTLNAQVISNY
ncbi:DUF4397 domain-containing protein [Pontibacter oryzae]|nr:DUF4397 domain-containing protein [Pontibacter oryzae]